MTDSKDRTPLYMTICNEISERIYNGEIGPQELLPSENTLCEQYKTSRETVRKAFKELEMMGLVHSQPRRGYFVNTPHHHEYTITFVEPFKDHALKYKDISALIPDNEILEQLGLPPNSKVIRLSRVIYEGERSIALDVKYLPYDKGYPSIESEIHYAIFPEIAAAKATAFDFHTEMEIRAQVADARLKELLECELGEPLLVVCRNFITRDGRHIGYNIHYMRQPGNSLYGASGYRSDE